jgi:hypothetical protein
MKKQPSKKDLFERLDWDDFEQWAGSRILPRVKATSVAIESRNLPERKPVRSLLGFMEDRNTQQRLILNAES